VFNYLDKDQDGFLVYNDFCELCEERRRNIDPFENILNKVRAKQQQQQTMDSSDFPTLPMKEDQFISSELASYKDRKANNRALNVVSVNGNGTRSKEHTLKGKQTSPK